MKGVEGDYICAFSLGRRGVEGVIKPRVLSDSTPICLSVWPWVLTVCSILPDPCLGIQWYQLYRHWSMMKMSGHQYLFFLHVAAHCCADLDLWCFLPHQMNQFFSSLLNESGLDSWSTLVYKLLFSLQDTIANGKAGTKAQCLKSASEALKDGKSAFIDRCNLDREQRADFVKLGGSIFLHDFVFLGLLSELGMKGTCKVERLRQLLTVCYKRKNFLSWVKGSLVLHFARMKLMFKVLLICIVHWVH